MADTLTTGGTIIVNGVTYNVADLVLEPSPDSSQRRKYNTQVLHVHIRTAAAVAAAESPAQFRNTSLGNGGTRLGGVLNT